MFEGKFSGILQFWIEISANYRLSPYHEQYTQSILLAMKWTGKSICKPFPQLRSHPRFHTIIETLYV